jgi:hypothetical protein
LTVPEKAVDDILVAETLLDTSMQTFVERIQVQA